MSSKSTRHQKTELRSEIISKTCAAIVNKVRRPKSVASYILDKNISLGSYYTEQFLKFRVYDDDDDDDIYTRCQKVEVDP